MRKKFGIFISVCICICAVLFISGCKKEKKAQYWLTFKSVEGYDISKPVDGKSAVELPTEIGRNGYAAGYTIVGWFWDEDFKKPFTENSLVENPINQDTTVYASYIVNEYTATFKNGEDIIGTSTFTVEDESIPDYPEVPYELGYDGIWNDYTTEANDKDIKAIYTPKRYSINYLDTYDVVNNNEKYYTIETPTFELTSLMREGFIFEGWYLGMDRITEIETGNVGDLTVIARWKPTKYDISYDLNGGVNSANNPTSYTTDNQKIVLDNPTFEGKFFCGWKLDGEYVSLFSSSLAKDVELKAIWSDEIEFSYTENSEGIIITGFTNNDLKQSIRALVIGETYKEKKVVGIAKGAFSGCSLLDSISLPFVGGNISATGLSETTLFGYIFGDEEYEGGELTEQENGRGNYYIPTSLKSVTIIGGKISGNSFSHCDNIISVSLGNKIDEIGDYVFDDCSRIEKLTFTNSVEKIGSCILYACNNLKEINYLGTVEDWLGIDIDSWLFETYYKRMVKLFINNELLEDLIIPNGIENISGINFSNLLCLKSVTIPSSVKRFNENSFYFCNNIKAVNYLGSIEDWCNITFEENSNPLRSGAVLCFNGEIARDIVIPNSISTIKEEAFHSCDSLIRVVISDSVRKIEKDAFFSCNNLDKVLMSINIDQIDDAFTNCMLDYYVRDGICYIGNEDEPCLVAMTDVNNLYANERVEEFSIANTTRIINSYCFWGVEELRTVVIPDSVKSIGSIAFGSNNNLRSITFSNKLEYIGDKAFESCTSLTDITLPDSLEYIGDEAFANCTGLKNITLPDSMEYIGQSAFASCAGLTNITLPNNINEIDTKVFYNCSNLSNINIPDSVETIYAKSFEGCRKIESIIIPKNVNIILKDAFLECVNLNDVYIESSTIANGITAVDSFGCIIANATTIYIEESIDTIGSYITENYTKGSTTVVDGITYNTYTKNE